MSNWRIVRIGLIVVSSASALFSPLPEQEAAIPWVAVLLVFLIFPFIAAVAAAILVVFPSSRLRVSRHDWDKNFLDFSHPEQFFYLGALIMLASGLVTLVRTVAMSGHVQPYSIAPVAMGVGIIVGLSALVYLSEKQARNVA